MSPRSLALMLSLLAAAQLHAQAPKAPPVAALLEDDGEALLKHLTNPTGDPGEGRVEKETRFSGQSCVKIIPMQRFHPKVPGWKFAIRKNPGPGEYRYVRFAWKADGCSGIMVQFHDERDWFIRYTAGKDLYGWGTRFVADKPPSKWTVMTRDLFADFGERTIQGIALTCFEGAAGYFDHIYFGRTEADLDLIDATGLERDKLKPAREELQRLWTDLVDEDASKGYLAFWTLVGSSDQATPFLKESLTAKKKLGDAKLLKGWIKDLSDDRYVVREKAFRALAEHVDEAAGLLKAELLRGPPLEVQRRVELLLRRRIQNLTDLERWQTGIKALEYIKTPAALECLSQLAADESGVETREWARLALERLRTRKD